MNNADSKLFIWKQGNRLLMMKFDDIWTEFSSIVDELYDGMAFFEGFIPFVRTPDIEHCLQTISKLDDVSCDCNPCWNNASDIPAEVRDYTISECANLFLDGKLASFDFYFGKDYGWIISNQKLMFMPNNSGAEVIIICFADWILTSKNPKDAIEVAIEEMRCIKQLFNSEELYIGADGLDLSLHNYLQID